MIRGPAAAPITAPIVALLLSMVSLCVGTSVAKSLFPVTGPAGMTALRIGLSAAMLVAAQRPWRWRFDAAQRRAVVVYGAVLAAMNLSFYQAIETLPLGVAIAIEFLGPLAVALLHSRARLDLLWIALAGSGVAGLVLPGGAGGIDGRGVGFALAAALFWALYILAGKHATAVVPEGRTLGPGLCVAALVCVPIGVAEAGTALLDPWVLAVGALVALLCSALPYSLELYSLKRMSPLVFGVLLSLEPAIGALAALAVLGETLGAREWAGMAAVGVASIGAAAAARPSPPVAAPASA